MNDIKTLAKLKEHKVCAIVRGIDQKKISKVAEALIDGGVHAIEVTFNTEGAAEMIEELNKNFSDRMVIGAGTVLDSETAKRAIDAGASFILSPTLNKEMIEICNRYSVLPVPGVLTPTEALKAWEMGARIVKVFPAGILGADYVKQLKGPLPQIDTMAVGAVGIDNIADFFKAGASAVSVGSQLVQNDLVNQENYEELTKVTKQFTENI